ncbi:GNAT family N-acetyltransferase [Phycicoccus sp. CMS6Z-2]|nr:GNAT family N-acetyltransferase [Phycicoccus flavus]
MPELARILAAQQGASRYPVRWPLPFPVEEFIVRPGELGAWVAETGGRVVGHASVITPRPGWEADGWVAATGEPVDRLAALSVLFVDPRVAGRGIGGRLLDTAVDRIRALGLRPVLDVVDAHSAAARLYRRRGWQVVGEAHPEWLRPEHGSMLLMTLPAEPPGVTA